VDIEIRDAASEDAGALAVLLDQLGYPCTEAEVVRRLANLNSTGSDECVVTLQDGEVVGMAAVHVSATLVDENRWRS
jgi:N-acetylglutamate synthase-like GNAT family acetyltransferase